MAPSLRRVPRGGQRARSGGGAGRSAAGGRDNGQRGGGRGTCREPPAHRRARFHLGRGQGEVNNSLLPLYTKGAGSRQGAAGTAGLHGHPPHPPTLLSFYVQADKQKAELAPPEDAERGRVRSALAHGTGQPAQLLHYSGTRFAAILPACA